MLAQLITRGHKTLPAVSSQARLRGKCYTSRPAGRFERNNI